MLSLQTCFHFTHGSSDLKPCQQFLKGWVGGLDEEKMQRGKQFVGRVDVFVRFVLAWVPEQHISKRLLVSFV